MFDFKTWAELVPVECAVNAALLYMGERRIIQFDMTYYSPTVQPFVERFVRELSHECVHRKDVSGNIVLYLRNYAHSIENRLRESDGTIEGGLRSTEFARLLDSRFYCCTSNLTQVFAHDNLVRVSIDVIYKGRSGALMVQMLSSATLGKHMARLHSRFQALSKRLQALDPDLQTALTIYRKPGNWKTGPEYVARDLAEL